MTACPDGLAARGTPLAPPKPSSRPIPRAIVPPMAFRAEMTVRFGDIDHAGIVYYPRFFHYFHIGLEEFFSKALGVEYHLVLDEHRIGLPTAHLEVDFLRPLRFGDHIDVVMEILEIGRSSATWRYVAKTKSGATVAVAKIVTVCVDIDTLAPIPLPDWLREGLSDHMASTGEIFPGR